MFDPCRDKILTHDLFASNLWLINRKWDKLYIFLNSCVKRNILVLVLANFMQIWVLTPIQPLNLDISNCSRVPKCPILELDTLIFHFQQIKKLCSYLNSLFCQNFTYLYSTFTGKRGVLKHGHWIRKLCAYCIARNISHCLELTSNHLIYIDGFCIVDFVLPLLFCGAGMEYIWV